jgi:hypothetical protein
VIRSEAVTFGEPRASAAGGRTPVADALGSPFVSAFNLRRVERRTWASQFRFKIVYKIRQLRNSKRKKKKNMAKVEILLDNELS